MSSEQKPTYSEIVERCEALAAKSNLVSRRDIGSSSEGRPIPALFIGDTGRDLPLMMAVGGTHGSEEVGRSVAMSFAEWLAGEGAANVERMSFVVVPCVNPDGSIRDSYHNADNVNIYTSYGFLRESTTPEGRAVETLALGLMPDCVVDCHGLAGGAMGDSEYIHPTLPSNIGLQTSFAIASEMDAAAMAAGFPQRHPRIHGSFKEDSCSLPGKLASETNAVAFTVETVENYYPLEDATASGLARLVKLVEIGLRTHDLQPYPGFPCDVLTGGPMFCLMPFGATYRERRINRGKTILGLVESATRFDRQRADLGGAATLNLEYGEGSRTFPGGIVVQAMLDPRCRVKSVSFRWHDGTEGELPESDDESKDGYTVRRLAKGRDGIVLVRARIKRAPASGTQTVAIAYDAPFPRQG